MSTWKQSEKTIKATGEKTITYEKPGNPNRIESRKVRIPHANGVGYWFHTSYWLIGPDENEKEYWKRSDAEEAAEKGV
jgi:hypothetical protein